MNGIEHLDEKSLRYLIFQTLALINIGSADEVAMQIAEQKGIGSEQAVADIIMEVKQELEKMKNENQVKIIKERHEKIRYMLASK